MFEAGRNDYADNEGFLCDVYNVHFCVVVNCYPLWLPDGVSAVVHLALRCCGYGVAYEVVLGYISVGLGSIQRRG